MRAYEVIILILIFLPVLFLTIFIGMFVLVAMSISFPATAYWISKIIIKILEKTGLRFKYYMLVSVIISIAITLVMVFTMPAIIFIIIGIFAMSAIAGKIMRPTMNYH